jgi:hypothetical protein
MYIVCSIRYGRTRKKRKERKKIAHTILNLFILDLIKMNSTKEEKKKFAHLFPYIHCLLRPNNFVSPINEVRKNKKFFYKLFHFLKEKTNLTEFARGANQSYN